MTTPARLQARQPARLAGSHRTILVALAASASAVVAAATASAAPTRIEVVNLVLRAGLAGLITVAGARARPVPLVLLAATATTLGNGVAAMLAGAVALVAALARAGVPDQRRRQVLGAVSAGLATPAVMSLTDIGFHGSTALIAGLALVPVLVSGYSNATASTRRLARRAAFTAGGVVALAWVGLAVAGLEARIDTNRAERLTTQGLELARRGETDEAASSFDAARAAFKRAADDLSKPWARLALVVPVLSFQADAAHTAAVTGERLAATGSGALARADYRRIEVVEGTVDLAALVAMQSPVAEAAAALADASSDLDAAASPWLLPPVAGPFTRLQGEVHRAKDDTELASSALAVAPAMLGEGGPRRYFVGFTHPAESRFSGGFLGSYGLVIANNGHLEFTESGPIADLSRLPGTRVLDDQEFASRYGYYQPHRYFHNLTASPDIPTDAAVIADLYEQATGTAIDGVLLIDPYALAALLELTGPVQVDGLDHPLDASNAADFLLREQYERFPDRAERKDLLNEVSEATFDALTNRRLPGPARLADVLGPVVRQGRLHFVPFDSSAQPLFQRLDTTGEFLAEPGVDFISLRTANAAANKLDVYLHRALDYTVDFDEHSGEVRATATISLTNQAPDGLPPFVAANADGHPPGTMTLYLSVYTPLRLDGARVDGTTIAVGAIAEAGLHAYNVRLDIPAATTVTLEFDLSGAIAANPDYRLRISNQPTVVPDTVTVTRRGRDAVQVLTDVATVDLVIP